MEIVKQYVEKVETTFDSRTLPPSLKKFDSTPGAPLQVAEIACSGTKYASQVIIADMKNLQALANAEHQESFVQDVRMVLHGWENFFSSYFTKEIKQMVANLNCLIKEIDDEPNQQPQSTTVELSERMKQVDEMLEEALVVREKITRSVMEIEQVWLAVARSQECIKVLKTAHANNAQRLEEGIKDLQRKLADEKESLRLVESLEATNAGFFTEEMDVTEAIAVNSTSFENVAAKGKALREEISKRLQHGEEDGGLPAPVQALRSLIAHYPIKE
ncbi:unnamed protein product [Urochloa decumbens]|uniref:Uncharacterized protein n=1 Tax=Urochloa decumbens TaxID=240449 RepID=A0ABC8ZYL1_9POAL